MTPNKQLFKRYKQGFIPEILESMYEDRKKYKNKMIAAEKQISANAENISDLEKEVAMCNNFQSAMKVNLNSEYGASGSPYYRFFDLRIAEAVTTSGQLAIRWIQQEMNIFLNKLIGTTDIDFIIASDTDSMYIDFSKLVENILPDHDKMSTIEVIREMDKICNNTIQPFIKKTYKKLDAYVNSYDSKMNMKRESLCDAAIWTAKKHYMLSVWNNEGVEYDKPKLKIVGLEAVMTGSLSIDARVKIKKAYEYIIYNNLPGLRKFTEDYKNEFNQLSVEEISIPKTCNGLSKYHDNQKIWGFKTPFHVKGALLYNHILKEKKLDKKYPEIKEGEKVRYLYIKEPNYYHTEALAFPEKLPEEFDLHPFIDYNIMFQKTYIDPVETILDAVGWKLKETRSLESLWS
jgi:DNA polymerase elongation subunit (family B)